MRNNFWKIVNDVLEKSDIILLVVDARMIGKTDNHELRNKAKSKHKTVITVINKADLVNKEKLESYKQSLHPCVFVSARKYYGMTLLRQKILRYAQITPVTVGVVGYPNTGKSSIINSLKGKSSAGVSSVSGYTKGRQNVKIDNKIRVIDTPGVLSSTDTKKIDELKISSAVNVKKNPEETALDLILLHKQTICNHYDIDSDQDEDDVLEAIARSLNRLKKGGVPDTATTAQILINEWQKGNIGSEKS
ncbi:MAG: GTPase [Nanobdellota archaeon]